MATTTDRSSVLGDHADPKHRCDESVEAGAGDALKARREADDHYLSNRLKALAVKTADLSTYPQKCLWSLSVPEYVEKYSYLEKGARLEDDFVTLAGRIMTIRSSSSSLVLADVYGDGAKLQLVSRLEYARGVEPEDFAQHYDGVELGDTVCIKGFPGRCNSGELSIFATALVEVLSPGFPMLPNVSLKRREPDDLVEDLLNFSFSPSKKLRVPDSGFTASNGSGLYLPSNAPETLWGVSPGTVGSYFPLHPVGRPLVVSAGTLKTVGSPVPSTKATSSNPPTRILSPGSAYEDQEAFASCRPLTPPLFPGGPFEGSVRFPYKVLVPHAPNSELTSHFVRQPTPSCNKNAPSGHGLFQALDLSGGPIHLPGQRRLSRVSSCSSLPRFSSDPEDQLMVDDADKSGDVVVTHWVPKTPVVIPSKFRPIIEEMEDDVSNILDNDEMGDGDFMEVVNEDDVVVSGTSGTLTLGEFGNLMPILNTSS